MPVLAYCFSEVQPVVFSGKGVGDLPVENLEHDGVRCYFSRSDSRDQILGPPAKQMALEFHRVIASIFHEVAVIPFRFPTILEDEPELRAYLVEQGTRQKENLRRLREFVQMEIHLLHKSTASNPGEPVQTERLAPATGTQYLRVRQAKQRELADLGRDLRRSGEKFIHEWRERPSAQSLRCFALIERRAVNEFKDWMTSVHISSNLSVRVSGPWPASEFVEVS
jgi:hypothetical protein